MNRLTLCGHLGQDAEVKTFDNGDSVLNFSLATTEKWKTKDGEQKEKTEWHRCVYNTKGAAKLAPYLTKGSKILLEGKVTYRTVEKGDSKVTYTDVRVSNLEFCGSAPQKSDKKEAVVDDADIPF